MKAEETRRKLISELEAQFSNANVNTTNLVIPEEPIVNFPAPSFEKPNMFMPKSSGRLEMITDTDVTTIKGIGFKNNIDCTPNKTLENQEIYSMKELINKNPENMQTFSYDEKIMKTQLALIKKKEWQDILFEDVDWFKQIDLTAGIRKLFWRF